MRNVTHLGYFHDLKVAMEEKYSTGRYKIKVIDCLRGKNVFKTLNNLKEMIFSFKNFASSIRFYLLLVDKC